MDAFKKFREQVNKGSAAVLNKLGAGGTGDSIITDEAELQRHQQLDRLYQVTRAAKHFQKDLVKGGEGLVFTAIKQLEVAQRLAEDCKKYGTEGFGVGTQLAHSAVNYGNYRMMVEKERDTLNRALSMQVVEPVRAMVNGQPLEQARSLVQRYEKMRSDAESLVKRVDKARLSNAPEHGKLQQELVAHNSAMAVLGKEAAAAMSAVETQQQKLTLQRMIAMVEAERNFHQKAGEVLDQLCAQLVSERQRNESAPPTPSAHDMGPQMGEPKPNGGTKVAPAPTAAQKAMYFLAEVMHPFEAETPNELPLKVGEFVVVRQVSSTGWSEGECNGQAGWFPSTYVEERQRVPASKVLQ